MTYARARPQTIVPWCERHGVPLFENAILRWSDRTERFNGMWEYDTLHAIDSGGYNVQKRWLDGKHGRGTPDDDAPYFPWSVAEYHEWLSEYDDEIEWAAVMDYACDPTFDDIWSVDERIEATLDNAIRHANLDPDYRILPVLQGRTVDDGVRCYEFYEDHGLPTDYVGVGSVSGDSRKAAVGEAERELRERIGPVKLHGFGVTLSTYRQGATFETADSQAWCYTPTNGKIYRTRRSGDDVELYEESMSDDDRTRKIESFKSYYAVWTWFRFGEPRVPVEIDCGSEWPDRDTTEPDV